MPKMLIVIILNVIMLSAIGTPKAGAKHELLLIKMYSETGLLKNQVGLKSHNKVGLKS
jgi:hypothetical protein